MANRLNHIHLKSTDPGKTADWYAKAFGFKVVSDDVRSSGDRFVRCQSESGVIVNISGAKKGERLPAGNAGVHYGLEHLGFDTDDVDADVARLTALGAVVLEGPIQVPNGPRIVFLRGPDDTRLELVERMRQA